MVPDWACGGRQGGEDCTHSCHPSAYQTWIYDLVVALRASLHRLPSPYVPAREAAPAPASVIAPAPEHMPSTATDVVDSGSEAEHSIGTQGGPALEGAGYPKTPLIDPTEQARREASAQRRRQRRLRVP